MAQYTHVSKNGEICFHHDTQKYHVFDETYSEVVTVTDTLHGAQIALKAYCEQYLGQVDFDGLGVTLDKMVVI